MTTPSPLFMPQFKKPEVDETTETVIAQVEPTEVAKIVRPGLRDEQTFVVHDGVCKAKHLKPGQRVRPYVHGEARGSERIVKHVERIDDGALVHIEWATDHPASEVKAAYRYFDKDLVGREIPRTIKVPALVPYEEV